MKNATKKKNKKAFTAPEKTVEGKVEGTSTVAQEAGNAQEVIMHSGKAFGYEKILTIILAAMIVLTMIVGKSFLGEDFTRTLIWWFGLLVLGVCCLPLGYVLFSKFNDFGWIFSKSIGLALISWLMWLLASIKIMKFTQAGCIISCLIVLILNLVLAYFVFVKKKTRKFSFTFKNLNAILFVEFLFMGAFFYWVYLRGFNPSAYGTEKFMDFGFMRIMERSDYMPPEDLWFSGKSINYYYVGQFVGTFIGKLCGISVDYGYNLFLMTIAAFAVALTYSLVRNCFGQLVFEKDIEISKNAVYRHTIKSCMENSMYDKSVTEKKNPGKIKKFFMENNFTRGIAVLAGLISSTAVVYAGNVHYIVYCLFKKVAQKFLQVEETGYWFPDATRYIGYNPDVDDKTIHEFPCYSFVLGDVHAHVINIIFVITVMGVLFAWLLERKDVMNKKEETTLIKEIFSPYILLIGFFIGFFHTTNFWDFPIYYVVSGAIILFSNIVLYNCNKFTWILTAIQGVLVFLIGTIVCLPFTLNFQQISTQIKLCDRHTPAYQLAVLWGLPILIVLIFVVNMIYRNAKAGMFQKNYDNRKMNVVARFFDSMKTSDLFMFVLGLCAIGLTFMPEVIYVKDIYEGAYSRANTMFKLTYQAYIMYGVVIGYALMKLLCQGKHLIRTLATIMLIVWVMTVGYFNQSIDSWFGGHESVENYQGIDATKFMETECYADELGTQWLNENAKDGEVVLETNGDSYTFYERVSVITGLPTVMGWRTHEWLWRSDVSTETEDGGTFPAEVSERENDISNFFNTTDINVAQEFIDKYNVSYIYIGKCEYEKFPAMNTEFMTSLGEVVFEYNSDLTYQVDGVDQTQNKTTYIIKVK